MMEEKDENPTGRQVEVENTLEQKVEHLVEDSIEEEIEETEELDEAGEMVVENVTDKPRKSSKKIGVGIIIIFCTVLIFYFGMTVYFMNHFYFGTEINDINVSRKSLEDVEVLMASRLQEYTLNLKERGGKSEQIEVIDVGLRYHPDEAFKDLKDSQNPFGWILACFNTQEPKMTVGVTYDEKLLKERINRLSCFDSSHITEPKNPSFQYVDNSYVIIDEIPGNKVDKEVLYGAVADALLKKEVVMDLEAMGCYIKTEYNATSQEIIAAKDALNQYVSSKITYTFGNRQEVLEGSTLNKWLTVDDNFQVTLEEQKVEDYIDILSKKYNIPGRTRHFLASSGRIIQISGGDFSRPINADKETQYLISAIKEGQTITKEPVYGETDFSQRNSDIGNTYVEIDLTDQYIWFYKKGSLTVEGDIVTGNVSAGHTTPKGIYSLKYKAKNVVLRGPGYASPVKFWMPFNGGIGMHDASWRSVFGGNIYKTNGSHGCINCPSNIASVIYNHIEPGTPVICY